MIELLERAAAADPGQVAVVTNEGSTTYGELVSRAHAVARALVERGTTRLAIVETDAAALLTLFGGAALVGVEPCQYQPDISPQQLADQLRAFEHHEIVSRRDDMSDAGDVISADALAAGSTITSQELPPRSATQPLLIRTTGTTGEPKAARHDWRVLARGVERVRPSPRQRWLLAYGPHQFAGVQVLLHVVASQATLVAPFPRQPRDGLTAMLREGVTCVSATPTYWRFLLQEARSRGVVLPVLQQVTLGGEAVPPDLLADVRAAFPDARTSQVYASTEHGSVTAVTDGRAGIGVEKLAGPKNPDGTLKIENGELWVRSRVGMLGYVGEEDGGSRGEPAWRPTGDLVEVVGDRIEFRGRVSEVINVGGVKVPPLPMENRLNALPGVAAARVFGRPNRLTGSIVAAEIVPEPGADAESVRSAIGAAVADLPRAWHPRSIAFVTSLPTRGDKTFRRDDA